MTLQTFFNTMRRLLPVKPIFTRPETPPLSPLTPIEFFQSESTLKDANQKLTFINQKLKERGWNDKHTLLVVRYDNLDCVHKIYVTVSTIHLCSIQATLKAICVEAVHKGLCYTDDFVWNIFNYSPK